MGSVEGSSRPSRWSWPLAVLLAAILLYLAFRGVSWEEVLRAVSRASLGGLVLAGGGLTGSLIIRSLRWRLLLGAEKQVSPVTVFWATVVGYLGNYVLPARAGEVIRSVLVGRKADVSVSFVLATALTERILDALTLVVITLVALHWLSGVPDWLLAATRVAAVLGLAALAGLFLAPRLEWALLALLSRLPLSPTRRSRIGNLVERFLFGVRAFQHPPRALGFGGLSLVIWVIDSFVAVQTAQALGLSLSVPHALVLLTALGLSSAAPSTPGYVGIFQFVAVTVLVPFGFSQPQALAYIIVFQAMTYCVVGLWGGLGLWRLGVSGFAPTRAERTA